jgi:hypothetical protein
MTASYTQYGEFLAELGDSAGTPWRSKPFTVFFPGTSDLVPLFSSSDMPGVPMANPAVTNPEGLCRFYCLPGRYDLYFNTVTTRDILVDPAPGEIALTDDPAANTLDTRYAILDTTGHIPAGQIPGGAGGSGPFRFIQGVPASTWTVPHNLGYRPVVQVFDGAGSQQIGDIHHTDANNLILTFSNAFSGEAECR